MLNFKKLIITTDFSERSLQALPYAVSLAKIFSADLKVVYAHESFPSLVAWTGTDRLFTDRDGAHESLSKVVNERIPEGVNAEAVVLEGSPVRAIIKYAKEQNADLIVMASHGRTGFTRAILGSTAEAVVRKAPCSVLTLKQPTTVDAESRPVRRRSASQWADKNTA